MPPNRDDPFATSLVRHGVEITYDGRCASVRTQVVACEAPVNIVYGSIPFAVMMASPSDLEDFVYGFSLTEGIVEKAEDIRAVDVEAVDGGVRVSVILKSDAMQRHLGRARQIAGRTGCGVCGVSDLVDLPAASRKPDSRFSISARAISHALQQLDMHQVLNQKTHAVHGALFCDTGGNVVTGREDVGRHNALDKLIGALMRSQVDPAEGFVVITSRASYEMVEKTARLGAPMLVAISAPTSLAIERAEAHGIALIGVARPDGALVFSGREKLKAGIS